MISIENKKNPNILLFLALLSISLSLIILKVNKSYINHEREIQKLSQATESQSFILTNLVNSVVLKGTLISEKSWEQLNNLFDKNKIICFISVQDSVEYWNSYKINTTELKTLVSDNKVHVAKLSTGWYLYIKKRSDNKTIILLDLIQHENSYNKTYLNFGSNSQNEKYSDLVFTLNKNITPSNIYDNTNDFIQGVIESNESTFHQSTNYLPYSFYILFYLFLSIFLLIKLLKQFKYKPVFGFLLYLTIIAILIVLNYTVLFPLLFSSSTLYISKLINIPLFKSVGDIAVVLLLFLTSSIGVLRIAKSSGKTVTTKLIYASIITIFSFTVIYLLYYVVALLPLSFFTNNIFENGTIVIASGVIIVLNVILYFLYYATSYTTSGLITKYALAISTLSAIILFIVSNIPPQILIVTLLVIYTMPIIRQLFRNVFNDQFLNHIIILILISAITSTIVSISHDNKIDNYQYEIAKSLAQDKDEVFENAYMQINNNLLKDQKLKNIVFADTLVTDNYLQDYITNKYFAKIKNKYKIQITNCGKGELIEIQPEKDIFECSDYFNGVIAEMTVPVFDSVLYRFNSGTEGLYYISKLTLVDKDKNKFHNLYIEFVSSQVPEGYGYTELLIDNKPTTLNLSGYSFAIYVDNHLTYKFGDYKYNTLFKLNDNFKINNYYNYNNFRHYAIQVSPKKFIIVSKEITKTTLKIVIFSIIFIVLSFLSLLIYLLIYSKKVIYLFKLNFKARLQTFIILTLTVTFVLTGITTLIYTKNNNKEVIEKELTEKSNSVLIELQHKLSSVVNLKDQDTEFLHQLLLKFSLVFFSDINLYNAEGELIATSRPEIFNKNLLSNYINPNAYNAIFYQNNLNYITEEKIGSLRYYSAYVPINLNNDKPIGILNLPYFARQNEITKSSTIMLSYLINIYVIIGILGMLIAIIFSRYLTKPLVLLKKSFASVSIDKHNEKIEWNKNDEIGILINEYNLMVDKLEKSSELLRISERESTWREVARQIAHEIKNPLTPMKLNVQYLEKAYESDDPEFGSKIKSISKSLITQIEVLNNVAEMFSDFAKTKSKNYTKVDLKKIIDSSIDLFKSNNRVEIKLSGILNKDELVTFGSEKDILRVITNIIKNAIQSIEKDKKGEIIINAINTENKIIIKIVDNGKGIPDDMQKQIFYPYFTTKTSGTGLGLAIVKNIMNEIGGKVDFTSNSTTGTTFSLVFPKYN